MSSAMAKSLSSSVLFDKVRLVISPNRSDLSELRILSLFIIMRARLRLSTPRRFHQCPSFAAWSLMKFSSFLSWRSLAQRSSTMSMLSHCWENIVKNHFMAYSCGSTELVESTLHTAGSWYFSKSLRRQKHDWRHTKLSSKNMVGRKVSKKRWVAWMLAARGFWISCYDILEELIFISCSNNLSLWDNHMNDPIISFGP